MGLERYVRWNEELEMKKKYFRQRKGWARRFAEENHLAKPGDKTTGMFGTRQYTVEIGPRGGLNVHGMLPWQDMNGWQWFEQSASQRKEG